MKDREIDRALKGIEEQCEKGQYWNAIIRTHELMMILFHRFDDVLKGKY